MSRFDVIQAARNAKVDVEEENYEIQPLVARGVRIHLLSQLTAWRKY